MIHVSDTARRIESFLLNNKGEKVFKIFIRINFNIDVFVFTTNSSSELDYQQDFLDFLLDTEDELSSYYKKNKSNLKVKFNIVDLDEAENDPYYANIFEGANENHIDLGPRYRFNSMLQKNNIVTKNRNIPIVTFYSYKGGMGRTTTMIAYALSLAANADEQKRKRVVIIDCDLEAPGYLNFFDLSEHNGLKSGKKNGLVEFISDAQFTNRPEDLDINDYIINVGFDNENNFAYNNLDNIWIVPAGNLNEGYADLQGGTDRNDYLEGLAKINLSSVHSVVQYFNLLFDKIKETLKPDIILIDSRTGFNDIFGTAALYLSSCVVGFFGFSRQTQPGLINLLKEYYNENNSFKLRLVFSILPENAPEDWVNNHEKNIKEFIDDIGTESKDYPTFLYLHRNSLLEKIGTGDDLLDSEFVKLVQGKKLIDYNKLFESINELFFKEDDFSSKIPTIKLRNIILKRLKNSLSNVSNFAEDTKIAEDQFFYRECMKELFNPKKFIIQGYKGTGKTYLYKSLANKEIAHNIQKWALEDEESSIDKDMFTYKENILDPIYIQVLPPKDEELVFNSIYYAGIEEPEYYFNTFWQIYTWNILLLRPEFELIKDESELCEFVKPVSGKAFVKEALVRIDELIKKGPKTLITIDKDIIKINDCLKKNNQRLFVLYDRLDTCINPLRWNKAVSPLINYWRNNCESFSNIVPKIFVRTDLFKQIEGTNTARLENNIIHIEWSISEVFGFFFKLIFSDKNASDAYWAIAKKVDMDSSYIIGTKNSFNKFPFNQSKSSSLGAMSPIIRVFFGNYVKVGDKVLGTPEQYFERELSNADNTAISLRPFINTMDSNAVEKGLGDTKNNLSNGILSPEIYASKSVREATTEKYFADLTQDEFSKDLWRFKEVIRTSIGEPYRFKALNEVQFEELITLTFDRITDSSVVRTPEDLKRLIFANGIMAEKITRIGRFYRFAPIYWYSWGLANSVLEKEEISRKKRNKLVEDEEYCGNIIVDKKGRRKIKCQSPYIPLVYIKNDGDKYSKGEEVIFVAKKDLNWRDSSQIVWYATNVRLKKSN